MKELNENRLNEITGGADLPVAAPHYGGGNLAAILALLAITYTPHHSD